MRQEQEVNERLCLFDKGVSAMPVTESRGSTFKAVARCSD